LIQPPINIIAAVQKCEQNTATPPVTTGGVFALGKPHVPVLTSDLNPEVARLMQCTKEKQHD
jgi:hypothetical protein